MNAARAFAAALDLTGVVLTKADGDARGGAALSVRQVTGKPIVFVGMGEKTEALEPFDPERMASRILGMGDVVSLVEQVQRQVDVPGGRAPGQEGHQGQGLRHGRPQGPARAAAADGRRHGPAGQAAQPPPPSRRRAAEQGDKEIRRQIAIINSMTRKERRKPGIIDGSRRRRIAAGSGVQVQDVNRLLKQFLEMQRMMKSMKGGKLKRMLGAFKGGMPPGFPRQ